MVTLHEDDQILHQQHQKCKMLKIVNTTSVDWGFGFESSLVLLKSFFFFFPNLKALNVL